ncbi:MAG TPA: nucleotidyltransferase family protein [Candidatus Cloacimonetes bacterium]|nr:nucleotidyltransferase family protein [Candidatus Cloacimonadota bacterium]HEX38358.1 nucleotidyltransferase family protein [Candidatus Cloacimonadota bacterium]
MKILGLILAAGFSSRMGDFKPLLLFENKTFIINIIEKLNSCCDRIFIVVGFNKDSLIQNVNGELEPQLRNKIILIENTHYSEGMFSSIQAGLHEMDTYLADDDYVILHLIDQPHIPLYVYEKLVEVANRERSEIIIPSYNMKAGHPIVFSKKIVEQVLASSVTSNLKKIIQQNKDSIHYLNVDNEQIIQDVDTQKDKEEFLS